MALLVAGWAISLFVVGLVLRFGQSAEVLAWGILFVVMPLSGVFYPVDALPTILRPIAMILPTTYAFEATRDLLAGEPLPWDLIAISLVGSAVVAVFGVAFAALMLSTFHRRGFASRFN